VWQLPPSACQPFDWFDTTTSNTQTQCLIASLTVEESGGAALAHKQTCTVWYVLAWFAQVKELREKG
jgi:hypothetical protein